MQRKGESFAFEGKDCEKGGGRSLCRVVGRESPKPVRGEEASSRLKERKRFEGSFALWRQPWAMRETPVPRKKPEKKPISRRLALEEGEGDA